MEVEDGEETFMDSERKIAETAYHMLEDTRTSMEEIAAKMLFIKKEAKPKSELRELFSQISLLFINLRQVQRSIFIEEDIVKAKTGSAKTPVDLTLLKLHNLMYEKNHYKKAITACKDFKSIQPDIELIPAEDFFSTAPEEIKGTMENPHDLMLKRLYLELLQRKELCKLCEELEEKKKSLQETVANQKKYLSSLPSHLKSLKKASMPVQHQLGIVHSKKFKQHHSAELLPRPLYIIYSQFLAQKEAFGEKIDLEIVGNIKDAQTFAFHQANKNMGVKANTENWILEEVAFDVEDDQNNRKRPKKVVNKESLPHAGMYESHPLNIILHVYEDEDNANKYTKLASLRFDYLLKLNVVCVGVEGSKRPESSILCNLFPDDDGVGLPHQMAKLIGGDDISFDENNPLRPYKWAQHLAGIDFLPEISPLLMGFESQSSEIHKGPGPSRLSLYRGQNHVLTVIQRVRSRKKA